MKKKKIIVAVLAISVVFLILIIWGVLHLKNSSQQAQVLPSTVEEFSVDDVRSQNTAENCLMSTGGVVYNLTVYIQNKQLDITKICGQIDPDLKIVGLKIDKITSNKVGILVP